MNRVFRFSRNGPWTNFLKKRCNIHSQIYFNTIILQCLHELKHRLQTYYVKKSDQQWFLEKMDHVSNIMFLYTLASVEPTLKQDMCSEYFLYISVWNSHCLKSCLVLTLVLNYTMTSSYCNTETAVDFFLVGDIEANVIWTFLRKLFVKCCTSS